MRSKKARVERICKALHGRLLLDRAVCVCEVDILAREHDAAVRVQRNAAHAAALGHDGVDRAVGPAAKHAAVGDVAEVQVSGAVDARAFNQSIAEAKRLDLMCHFLTV